ncbi:transcription factor E2F7 [Suncus etruscus]|uniref:transcription factor E2F7 n=1 Tax=Suncus etruscus TaxID=109475 RepID=UPI002110D278|nr:transcription factor E2F7 [Suncus etruscus]
MEVSCLTLKDLIHSRPPRLDFEDGENAQKENIFVDLSRMAPKTPIKNEPIDLSKQKLFSPERSPITPVKLVDRQQIEPWTPTANLKMLISAASPDIRDREKKKELFRPIENKDNALTESLQLDAIGDAAADEFDKQRPSRKQKSLGLLCQKFLARYPSYPLSTEKTTISLDEVAISLGVERRRIYDIVNVLESLQLVSRVAKNQYGWHGRHSLPQTLRSLQRLGEEQRYREQMAHLRQKELDLAEEKFGEHEKEGVQEQPLLDFSDPDSHSLSANSRKDKSLRIMSQKFVMLFLVSKTKIVTLDVAAKILIEESQDAADHSKYKTKVRRLYDIANVLSSLALIKKVHVTEERGRKPAFKWIGPVDFSTGEPGGYSLEVGSMANVYKQTIEETSLAGAFPRKRTVPPVGNLDNSAPSPIPAVESEFGVSSLVCPAFPVASTMTDLKAASGQVGIPLASAASDMESLTPALLASQPLVYVPSSSLFMLYGSLQEGPSPGPGAEREGMTFKGSIEAQPVSSAASSSLSSSMTSTQKRPREYRSPKEEEELASKRLSHDYEDRPLPLVVPKKSPNCEDTPSLGLPVPAPLKDHHAGGQFPATTEVLGKAIVNMSSKWQNPDVEKHPHEAESSQEPSLLPYLYLQTPAGLNGFNVILSGPQHLQNQGPPLGIPCMVLPSPALAPFPVLYSPALPQPAPSASSSLPPSVPLNLGLPSLGSASHLLISPTTMVNPKSPARPATDPQLPGQCSLNLSPVMSRSHQAVQPESPAYEAQAVSMIKLQQSPAPMTPKSIRGAHRETFFKTPGNHGEPPKRRERNQTRPSSSAQRRLEIPSSGAP